MSWFLLPCKRDKRVLSSLAGMDDFPIRTPRQLGPLLQGYRKAKGLTQSQTGDRVGLAQKAVSKLELAPERASFTTIFKLLSALDLELVLRPRRNKTQRSEW